jgi:soluble lytic murein transglycosylase-like protein
MRKNNNIIFLTITIVCLLFTIATTPSVKVEADKEEDTMTSSTMVEYIEISLDKPEPTSRELIDRHVQDISAMYGVESSLIHSIIWYESRYIPDAKNKSETCLGLMQVCPKWHKKRAERLGVTDYLDPYSSILLGVDYISELQTKYKDIKLVLMLYNMSHKKAFELHRNGEISWYAKSVLKRANEIKQGVK